MPLPEDIFNTVCRDRSIARVYKCQKKEALRLNDKWSSPVNMTRSQTRKQYHEAAYISATITTLDREAGLQSQSV